MAKRGKTAAAESATSGWRSRIVDRGTADPRDLLPHPMNHRQHPVSQRDHLRAAIREVGFVRSVTVNRTTGHVLDGHLRLDLALEDKEPLIDVEWVELSEAEERLVLASMDQITAGAEIDPVKLDALLQEVQASEPDLQRLLAGMATDAGLYLTDDPPEITEDEAPEPPAEPVTQPGDLWILGNHRLLCGDSTKAEDVGRLMDGEKAALCFTSPPYGQQRDYTEESKGHTSDWDGLMQGVFGNLPMADDGQVLVNLGLIHRDGEWLPYWDGWIEWMRQQGWRRFGWYVWDQLSGFPGVFGGRCAPSHEFIFHFNKATTVAAKHVRTSSQGTTRNTGSMGANGWEEDGRGQRTTGAMKIPDSVWRIGRSPDGSIKHSAKFPVRLPSFAIETYQPDLAYEPFSGSGTTIIAAEQLDRRCYAMEISPQYCDVAVTRWEKLTGQVAERVPASEPVTEHANG
jgi:DNA modification methylase